MFSLGHMFCISTGIFRLTRSKTTHNVSKPHNSILRFMNDKALQPEHPQNKTVRLQSWCSHHFLRKRRRKYSEVKSKLLKFTQRVSRKVRSKSRSLEFSPKYHGIPGINRSLLLGALNFTFNFSQNLCAVYMHASTILFDTCKQLFHPLVSICIPISQYVGRCSALEKYTLSAMKMQAATIIFETCKNETRGKSSEK